MKIIHTIFINPLGPKVAIFGQKNVYEDACDKQNKPLIHLETHISHTESNDLLLRPYPSRETVPLKEEMKVLIKILVKGTV